MRGKDTGIRLEFEANVQLGTRVRAGEKNRAREQGGAMRAVLS